MLSKEEIKRYARHLVLPEIGEEGQLKLKQARVLVIGAGGLGCSVLQYLTAAGVGTIGVIDPDRVDESNLQRQILFSAKDIGKYKVDAAKEKLKAQNPFIDIITYCESLERSNALENIKRYDLVLDGSDNFATRYLVNDACVILHKPFVFGSIFKFDGQVSVFNYQKGPTYRCLYPEPPSQGEVPNCAETGVIGVLPGICGTLMANEAIKMITGVGEVLSGRLLSFDSLSMNFSFFQIQSNPDNHKISALADYEVFCGTSPEISAVELKKKINSGDVFQLIDVREEQEYRQKNIGGLLIPLDSLAMHIDKIDPKSEVIVHCASGARSKKAVQILKEKGFQRVFNLKNGLLDF